MSKLYLFNTTIAVPSNFPADISMDEIPGDLAADLVRYSDDVVSAVGHEGTARIMSELLNYPVEVNRIQAALEVGDRALCFKLADRLPEGVVLSAEELAKLRFSWVLMTRTA